MPGQFNDAHPRRIKCSQKPHIAFRVGISTALLSILRGIALGQELLSTVLMLIQVEWWVVVKVPNLTHNKVDTGLSRLSIYSLI